MWARFARSYLMRLQLNRGVMRPHIPYPMQPTPTDPAFERAVLTAFSFVSRSAAPRIIDSSYSAMSFGNADIGLEGDTLRIRVTRDRGQYLVDVSPLGVAEWFDQDAVLRLVGAEESLASLSHSDLRSLELAAGAFHTHLAAIESLFRPPAWPESRIALKALQERRAHELFG